MDNRTAPCATGCTIARQHIATQPPDEHPSDCPGCLPRPASQGLLCWGCHRNLAQMLGDLPNIDVWLAGHIALTGSAAHMDGMPRSTNKAASKAPIDLAVVDIQVEVRRIDGYWTERLVDEASLTGPKGPRRLGQYLLTHIEQVQRLPFVTLLIDDLENVTRQASKTAPWRPPSRHLPGVPCPECHTRTLVKVGGRNDVECATCDLVMSDDQAAAWLAALVDGLGRSA